MTLTEKEIQRMVYNYQYILRTVESEKTIKEQMTQLYHFLKDQMQDVERIDRQEAMQARIVGNDGYTKSSH